MAIGDLTSLPDPLANAIQQNMLAREFLDALRTKTAYTRMCSKMSVASHIGATLTFNQMSEFAVDLDLNDPDEMGDIDNGLTDDEVSNEQFGFTLGKLARTTTINLLEQKAHIVDYAMKIILRQGRQALRIREGRCRNKLTASYHGGATIVTGLVSDGSSACTVDNVVGFTQIMAGGQLKGVSDSSGLRLPVANKTDPTITLAITGVDIDVSNVSSAKAVGGQSGTLHYTTISSGNRPVVGQVLVASSASRKIRPNGKISTQALNNGDTWSIDQVLAGKTILGSNGVDPMDDGFYRCVASDLSMQQLLTDENFRIAFQGAQNASELLYGKIIRYMGVEFVTTTEAIIQQPTNTGASQVNVAVARPILLGKGAIMRGEWKGLEEFVMEQQAKTVVHDMQMLDGIAFAFRSPIDRLGERCTSSYQMIEDHCTPSDAQTTSATVVTADSAYFKRGLQFEHMVPSL